MERTEAELLAQRIVERQEFRCPGGFQRYQRRGDRVHWSTSVQHSQLNHDDEYSWDEFVSMVAAGRLWAVVKQLS